jgi:TRAP-type uncharacterized transport system fused permease subunit
LELEIFFFAIFGLWALSAAVEGHWEHRLNIAERLLVLATGAALLWPADRLLHIGGLVAFAVLFGWTLRASRRATLR